MTNDARALLIVYEKAIDILDSDLCPECNGSGEKIFGDQMSLEKCNICHGTGLKQALQPLLKSPATKYNQLHCD